MKLLLVPDPTDTYAAVCAAIGGIEQALKVDVAAEIVAEGIELILPPAAAQVAPEPKPKAVKPLPWNASPSPIPAAAPKGPPPPIAPNRPTTPTGWSAKHSLEHVAQLYRANEATGQATPAIAASLGVTPSNARQLVARARKAGLLPTTAAPSTCPHCHREFHTRGFGAHLANCADRPTAPTLTAVPDPTDTAGTRARTVDFT